MGSILEDNFFDLFFFQVVGSLVLANPFREMDQNFVVTFPKSLYHE